MYLLYIYMHIYTTDKIETKKNNQIVVTLSFMFNQS